MPDPDSTPRRPAGLLAAGGRLWDAVTDAFEIGGARVRVLLQAARTVDTLADLDTAMRRVGVLVDSPQGMKAHPGSGRGAAAADRACAAGRCAAAAR